MGRVRVCMVVHRCARVCTGIPGHGWMCTGVHRFVQVCMGVCRCEWECVGVCMCVRVCGGVREFSEFLQENRVLTSADFNMYPIQIFFITLYIHFFPSLRRHFPAMCHEI